MHPNRKRKMKPGHYYYDGKDFSQPKLRWRSEDIPEIFECAEKLRNAGEGFRMVIDPNAEEGLAIRPNRKDVAEKDGGGGATTNFMGTCPPLPMSQCSD